MADGLAEGMRARLGVGLIFAAVSLALDQASKWLMLLAVMDPPRVIEVTGFLNLVLVWNRGVSFGMFSDGVPAWALGLFGAVVVALLLVWLGKAENRRIAIGLGLVIGGAAGNIIDRAVHGAVVDFLDFHYAGWHWPAFNIADSAICVGVGLLLLDSLFFRRARPA